MGGHGWAHVMLWVGTDGHRLLLMVTVWVWVQIRRKMLGSALLKFSPMIGENQQLLTDEPVELQKEPVEIQDCAQSGELPIV
jgi:hypothetical protein